MFQRAALHTGEYLGVDRLDVFFAAKDQTGTGPTQSFVSSGSHYISVGYRAGVFTGSNQTGNVRHIHKEFGTDFVGNFTQTYNH